MSTIIINGTLLLDGNMVCSGDITITPSGKVIPIPDADDMKTYWSIESHSYITSNGAGRVITSELGNITVNGIIDGYGEGFDANEGPGSNSVLTDNLGFQIPGYGATHAGTGSVIVEPGATLFISEEFYISIDDITNRYVRLMGLPDSPENVAMNIEGGPSQTYGVDFYVEGNVLKWTGTAIELLLSPGDIIRILYVGNTDPIMPNARPAYGNHEKPVSLGSGSGFYHDPMLIDGENTSGGGAIKLVARSGEVSIDGTILVDGSEGTHSGGGSGGSIWVVAWKISGVGSLLSRGGDSLYAYGGGGGGGYISLWYESVNNFSGLLSVDGRKGGTNGKTFTKRIEPLLEEKFTGPIWNIKWWEHFGDTTQNNSVLLNSPQYVYESAGFQSLFSVSGKNILTEMDYIPNGSEPNMFNESFLLYADASNWVGIARKWDGIFGVYSVNGSLSQSALPYAKTSLTFRLNKQDSTFSFQFYDGTTLPQTIYSEVIPELENKRFYIRSELTKPVESTWVTEYLRLTSSDVSNKYVTLSGKPLDTSNVTLNLIGGSSQYNGVDFYVLNNRICWDTGGIPLPIAPYLETLIAKGDKIRVLYPEDMTSNAISCMFDNLKIFDGIIYNAETKEPNLYVDPAYGSDTSDGRQLTPLKNLFVATAWAQHGGNVILYDGTHNSTEVRRKNLTLMGAYGAKAIVTTKNVMDTTGSGWETNALSFYDSQSSVRNLTLMDSTIGIGVENTDNFEVSEIEAYNCSKAVKFQKCDPSIIRSKIHDCEIAIDFTSCPSPYIYSNIITDSSTGLYLADCTGAKVLSNTFDTDGTAINVNNNSSAIIASNNITWNDLGIQISSDSTVYAGFNNYYQTLVQYSGTPDTTEMNINLNPLYVDHGGRDYHIESASPNIGAGSVIEDTLWVDFDGVNRSDASALQIGSLVYFDGTHTDRDWYVSGNGNDFVNFGNRNDPFKTLDRAYQVADSTVHIDGGHYDTFYLSLKAQSIDLNTVTVYTESINHMVSYITLTPYDIEKGYAALPGFIPGDVGYENIAINIVHGSTQYYGTDYIVQYGHIYWKGYALEPLLAAGDTFRVTYLGVLQTKALSSLMLAGNFSNYDQERAIFISPNGSDSSVMGGDGTNTGGNGTYRLPFRTVDRALRDSSSGDNIVMMAGEYPIFTAGLDNRILVPAIDRTGIVDKYPKYFVEDMFAPQDFRSYNYVESSLIPWTFTYSGDSSVSVGAGFMNLTYDGTTAAQAQSIFTMDGDWEVQATLRNAIDPLFFSVTCPDQTVFFKLNDTDYTAGAWTGGIDYHCWGQVDVPPAANNQLITEYVGIDSNDVRNKGVNLAFIPEPEDFDDISVNFVGGTAQNYGDDFIFNKGRIEWDGLGIDGDVEPGDIMRVIYHDRSLSNPVRVMMSKVGKRFTVKAFDTKWNTVFLRDMVGTATEWNVNFYMNETSSISHTFLNGKGFVSRFLAISDSIEGIEVVPYQAKTERRVVLFYKDRT